MRKKVSFLIIFILLAFNIKIHASTDSYRVHFMDTGQSDCILLQGPKGNYLVDTGLPYTYQKVLTYLKGQGISCFEGVIITHFHDDHYGGLEKLMEDFKVKNLWLPEHQPLYSNFLFSFLNNTKGVKVNYFNQGFIVRNSQISLYAILPKKEDLEIENNNGIVLIGVIDGIKYAFMADVESKREEEMIKNNEVSICDVIKVPHHGLDTSSTVRLINFVKPRAAVITCNGIDSPNSIVVERYEKCGSAIFRTDTDGNIVLTSPRKDKSIEINCNKMIK